MELTFFIKQLIGEKAMGVLDYFRYPHLGWKLGGPFNGQRFRKKIFHELIKGFDFDIIIETGAFKGTTTEFMQKESGLRVLSVENNPRNYGYVWVRFAINPKIRVYFCDSRIFLKNCSSNKTLKRKTIFFYLDAHWEENLPLLEEVRLIFQSWPKSVVMIDDFRVPNDDDYGYDDYGKGKVLEFSYLSSLDYITPFYPSEPAMNETGKRRGSVVIAANHKVIKSLDGMKTLER